MARKIALIGLVAIFALPLTAAFAQAPSGYGTEGPNGKRLDTRARSTFQRGWNAGHESQNRARASASWMRRHGTGFPLPF